VNRPVAVEYKVDRLTFIPTLDPFPANADVAVSVSHRDLRGRRSRGLLLDDDGDVHAHGGVVEGGQ